MTRSFVLLACLLMITQASYGQRFIDRAGHVSFYSEAPLENIEAHNEQALCILDIGKGEVAASMLMKAFGFEKALMQEHFNEKYVESDKYPKATFTGKLVSPANLDLSQQGTFTATVKGEISIHGQTRPLETTVEFQRDGDTIIATSTFPLRVADFKITIPSLVVKNIAEVIEVRTRFELQPYE